MNNPTTTTCLICDAPTWPLVTAPGQSAPYLCYFHRRVRHALALDVRWARLQLAAQAGSEKWATDWRIGQSHTERQCAPRHQPVDWRVKFADVLRVKGVVLEHGDSGEEQAA